MSKISIIGAGQAGMQLAAGLLIDGHDVTLYSDRDEQALASGRFPSSAAQFYTALRQQREAGLDFWPGERTSRGLSIKMGDGSAGVALDWSCEAFGYMQAVDQRLKFPIWMSYLRQGGASVVIEEIDVARMDQIASESDLTIVAAGKGEIAKLFEIDVDKCTYTSPQRHIGLASVAGVEEDARNSITLSLIPGVGEFVMIPGITAYGPASFWVFEGILGGPMDRWSEAKTPDAHLEMALDLLKRHAPWDYERCHSVSLTDTNGYLSGKVTPTVRKPIATLPSGRKVVGMADVLFLNDPVCGQGANSAAKHATIFRRLIQEQQGRHFDQAFMQWTFDTFWEQNQWAMHFTNAVIAPELSEHALRLLVAAQNLPEIAHRFQGAYDNPSDLAHWFADPSSASKFLEDAATRHLAKHKTLNFSLGNAIVKPPSWANA